MTLQEAIEHNTEFLKPLEYVLGTDTYKALALGIEALKLVMDSRERKVPLHFTLLLGETKD